MSEQHEHKMEMVTKTLQIRAPIRTQVTKTVNLSTSYLRFEPPFVSGLTETHPSPIESPGEFVQRILGRESHIETWDEAVQTILEHADEISWPVTLPTLYKEGEIPIAPPSGLEPEE